MVLMPSPKHVLLRCLTPGCTSPSDRTPNAGHGITAELVPDSDGEGLAVSVATSRAAGGEAFVSALSAQLESLVSSQSTSLVVREESQGKSRCRSSASSRFRQEAQAYYYYSKLLYDTRQTPGQAATEFAQSFVETCATLSPTALEHGRLVAECRAAVDRLCALVEAHDGSVLADLGLSAEFQPWLRSSVERCVYMRVGGPLWSLYEGRHSAEDAQYTEKVRMLAAVNDVALLEALDIRLEFRGSSVASSKTANASLLLLDDSGEGASELTPSTSFGTEEGPSSQVWSLKKRSGLCVAGPYERAAAALSQIEVGLCSGRGCTPREIIEALTLSQLEMKTCAFEASASQIELHAMDDVMPVFIFVLVRSSLLRPFACASFMQDALSQDERLDNEGRAVLLLESAARYVAYDWDISELLASAKQQLQHCKELGQ